MRQRRECAAKRGERGELGKRLVRMDDETDAPKKQQEGGGRSLALMLVGLPVARRQVEEREGAEEEGAACEAGAGMELEDELQQLAEGDGEPVIERRIVEP